MTLEEILANDVPINNEILEKNKITLAYIKENCRELSLINREKFLEVLKIFEEKKCKNNTVDFQLKFIIMSTLIYLNEFKSAYEYADFLFKNDSKNRKDYVVYLLILSDILSFDQNPNLLKQNIYVSRFDENYQDIALQNQIREAIEKREYIYARSLCQHLYKRGSIDPSSAVIRVLINAAVRNINENVKEAIKVLDYRTIEAFLDLKKSNIKNAEDFEKLYAMLCNVLDGIPLNVKVLPSQYDIHDIIEAQDIDKIASTNHHEVISSFIEKIKEERQRNIENDYKGELSFYLDGVIEDIYNNIINGDIESASDLIWSYLEAIKKDHWIFYFLNRLDELDNKKDTLTDEYITSSLAKIFDEVIAVAITKTEKSDNCLIEKYMGETKENTGQDKEDNFDFEYNYQIPYIESVIESIHNGTISYENYAKKEFFSEDDLFTIVIMARENYRYRNYKLGDLLISIVRNLIYGKEKYPELISFINAVEKNKGKINAETPFIKEVKTLIQK